MSINNNTHTSKMNSNSNSSNTNENKNKNIFDIENDQFIETPWNIIESYFKGQHLERLV